MTLTGKQQDDASAVKGPATLGRSAGRNRIFRHAEALAMPIVWLLTMGVFALTTPDTFLTSSNFISMFSSQTTLIVLSLAALLPLTAGEFDLSIAAQAGLCGMLTAVLNVNHHWDIVLAVLAGLGLSLVVGAVNAALCVYVGVDSMIVTLGMATFLGGVINWISSSTTVSGVSPGLSDWIVVHRVLSIPLEFYYGLVLAVLVFYFMQFTPPGLRMLIVGRGRDVARLSGIRVKSLRAGSFLGASLLAGIAGIINTGTSGSADPSSHTAYLLPAFAAAFLGATAIRPGRFNVWGTVIAIYFLITGITGLQQLGAQTYVQNLFYGGALIVAVVLSFLVRRRTRTQGG